jgi:hypothetical protein
MGIGYEIWHLEGRNGVLVWNRDNIKMNLQIIGRRSPNVAQGRKGGGGSLKCFIEFSGALQ